MASEIRSFTRWHQATTLFIAVVLLLLAVLPFVVDRRSERLASVLSEQVEPVDEAAHHLLLALSRQGTALSTYASSGDSLYVEHYRFWNLQQDSILDYLNANVEALGAKPTFAYSEARAAILTWERALGAASGQETIRAAFLQAQPLRQEAIAATERFVSLSHSHESSILKAIGQTRRTAFLAALAMAGLALVALVMLVRMARQASEAQLSSVEREREVHALLSSRERMVRGLTHNLKSPLGVIDGYAELLEADAGTAGDQRQMLQGIRESAQGMSATLESLLNLYRNNRAELAPQLAPVDLGAFVTDLVEDYRAPAQKRHLQIRVASEASLEPVVTDPKLVQQILGNLLDNAIKYTPAGGRIDVRVESMSTSDVAPSAKGPDSAPWLSVQVRDTGRGIPAIHHEAIFSEYYRTPSALASGQQGTGIGLAIARRFAEQLGGRLTLESEPGLGSTFTLSLPTRGTHAA